MQEELSIARAALTHFPLEGDPRTVAPYGEGHINVTYLVVTDRKRYILQKMNRNVFPDSDALMQNISRVTAHLEAKGIETLHVVRTNSGESYYRGEDAWRVYDFIEDTVTYQTAPDHRIFAAAARAFGQFQRHLADFEAGTLSDAIPHFHDTPHRFEAFCRAVEADSCDRAKGAEAEIAFFLARKDTFSRVRDGIADGTIPLRVTHNDTKLNNILMDAATGEARAVIDLDTVMPGSLLYDFGDAIRFGASTAKEDEEDLSRVHFDIDLFRVYAEGYCDAVRDTLTPREAELMWYGAYLMTAECGMRFLTDYLSGDTYFRTHYPTHNLVRARTQIRLASEMWDLQEEMQAVVSRILKG